MVFVFLLRKAIEKAANIESGTFDKLKILYLFIFTSLTQCNGLYIDIS
jgi:hypothetical protein